MNEDFIFHDDRKQNYISYYIVENIRHFILYYSIVKPYNFQAGDIVSDSSLDPVYIKLWSL
jgi:hypothetical protein